MQQEKEKTAWYNTLASTFSYSFKKLHPAVNTFLIVLVTVVATLAAAYYFVGDKILDTFERINRVEPVTQSEAQILAKNNVIIDSIQKNIEETNSAHIAKLNSTFRKQIQRTFTRDEYIIPNCIAINYWTVHNGGKTTKADSKRELDVHISSSLALEEKYKTDRNEPIERGFGWLSDEMIIADKPLSVFYVNDVTQFPDMYVGRAKQQLVQSGVKSFYATMLHNEGTAQHFVSMDFDVEEIKESNPQTFLRFMEISKGIQKMLFYGNYGLDQS